MAKMNRYAIYNQDLKISYGPFIAIIRDVFEFCGKPKYQKETYEALKQCWGSKWAIVDQNGTVLVTDVQISKFEIIKDKLEIHIYKR